MSDPLRFVKPAVRRVAAYTLAPRPSRVKLDQNENPYELPDTVKRHVLERAMARPWARYPDFNPEPFCARLAAHAGWRADGVLAGNGSNELIEALLMVTVSEGTPVVIPEPTFTLYSLLTGILGGRAVPVPLDDRLRYDAPALSAAQRDSGATLTIVCSPNNPTGCSLSRDAIEELCAGSGLVVVDEAYGEFATWSAVELLERHPNLIVLRTFSKAVALAGLRVGYLLAAPELVREINKARLPYNLNFFSQIAAETALDDWGSVSGAIARILREREALAAALARVPGVRCYPSDGNFLLVELRDAKPRPVFEALAAEGILVRDVSRYPRLERCLRISVGSPEESLALLDALPGALERGREQLEAQ
jgi:histidinol-phosphate aminotransferase